MKDLIVLAADKNMEFLIRGLLPRIPRVERIHEFSFDILVHPQRDPGIYNDASGFLRTQSNNYSRAIVMLDHDGSGREEISREGIENHIENQLARNGWQDRACAIVIKPELENWVWVAETRIHEAISWDDPMGVYAWLAQKGWKAPESPKPIKPKEAFEAALKQAKTPRSSSIYQAIASTASYRDCQDEAFLKLIAALKTWFNDNTP